MQRRFFTNTRGETAVVALGANRPRPVEQPVSHLRLAARFSGFERWVLLDDNLDWHDVLVEFDDDGFECCETGKDAVVAGVLLSPEEVVRMAIERRQVSEGETIVLDPSWLN